MSSNRLKLNADKTEFIWLGTRQQLVKVGNLSFAVGGQNVVPVHTARDLGVILDSQLTLDAHAKNIVRGCFYQLRQLRVVQRSLPQEARRALAASFIASRLDYCNSVFYGVSKSTIHRLQVCMNAAARLVVGLGKYEHVTPVLRDILHWLPVTQRINYKIAVLAFDCVRGNCPAYFRGVCTPLAAISGRSRLRAAGHGDAFVPPTRTVKLSPRSFRVAAPTVWNSLPKTLRQPTNSREQFRRGLKTHLFMSAYA